MATLVVGSFGVAFLQCSPRSFPGHALRYKYFGIVERFYPALLQKHLAHHAAGGKQFPNLGDSSRNADISDYTGFSAIGLFHQVQRPSSIADFMMANSVKIQSFAFANPSVALDLHRARSVLRIDCKWGVFLAVKSPFTGTLPRSSCRESNGFQLISAISWWLVCCVVRKWLSGGSMPRLQRSAEGDAPLHLAPPRCAWGQREVHVRMCLCA